MAIVGGGVALAMVFGLALEWLLFRHFYHRDHLDQVLLTFGLIYIFEELRSILWGDDVHGVPIPQNAGLVDPAHRHPLLPGLPAVHGSGVCIALALGLYLLISKTRLGMKIRAGAFNRDMAESLGVNIKLIHAIVFALGVGLAAVAGMVAAPVSSVYPNMGSSGAHHVFCGGGDRRHRLRARRADRGAAGGPGGHLWQGAAAIRWPACWSTC